MAPSTDTTGTAGSPRAVAPRLRPHPLTVRVAHGGGRLTARKRAGTKVPAEHTRRSPNLRIDDDSYRRLNIHALMRDTTVSELVREFAQGLRESSLPHRIGGKPEQGGHDPPGDQDEAIPCNRIAPGVTSD